MTAPNTKFKLSERQLSSNIADETIILNHQDGIYYGLNETGAFIWDKLKEKPMSLKQLVVALMDTYEVDESDAEKDLSAMLEELLNEKLIEAV